MLVSAMNFSSRTNSTMYFFINLINYPTGVSRVIFAWGKGVHRWNDHRPLDKPFLKYHPEGWSIFVVEVETLLEGDQSKAGSNQKPWRGEQNFQRGPIFQ